MPKYKITETDNTSSVTLASQPNIVYIPGGATDTTEPKLFRFASELKLDAFEGFTLIEDASYKLAKELLSLGMQVLYQGFAVTSGSTSGITISESDWKKLGDKNLYNVRFLTTGGYALDATNMIKCAAKRGDCIALVDHASTADSVSKVRNAIETYSSITVDGVKDPLSFAAAFTPWIKTSITGDDYVPASFGYLLAYARSVQSNPLWKAVAGVFRGVIPELEDVAVVYTNAECEVLQARATSGEVDLDDVTDNVGIAINPIAYRRYSGFDGGFNFVVNGNRTLHSNDGETIATSFLNVRALVTEISKTLYDASVTYTFEQNSDVLWINFTSLITPVLDKMQTGEGIQGYRLDRLPTDKKARLKARLTIVPIEAVEDFELEIYLENSLDTPITVIQ